MASGKIRYELGLIVLVLAGVVLAQATEFSPGHHHDRAHHCCCPCHPLHLPILPPSDTLNLPAPAGVVWAVLIDEAKAESPRAALPSCPRAPPA